MIDSPLPLKIHTKLSLLGPKIMAKNFLNHSIATLRKPDNEFVNRQNDQNTGVNLTKSVNLWFNFRSTSSNFTLLAEKKNEKLVPRHS